MCDSIADHNFEKEFQGTELKMMTPAQLDAHIINAAELVRFNIALGLKTFAGESACSLVWAIRERDERKRATRSKLSGGFCQNAF